MNTRILILLIGLLLSGCEGAVNGQAHSISSLVARDSPLTAIDEAASALGTCDIRRLLKLRLPYKDPLEMGTVDKMTKECQEDPDIVRAQAAFAFARDLTPTFSKDGLKAVYNLEGLELGPNPQPIVLIKFNGRWYLADL